MCREDSSTPMLVDPSQETPPRAWGRPTWHQGAAGGTGNTPTCVGKTCGPAYCRNSRRKHPHVRGEDVMELTKDRNGVETPPRAWGRLEWFVSNTVHKRNTPTCVGKTKRVFYTTLPHQKHPHVRGEDGLSYRNRLIEAETPPRAWGRLTTHSIRQQKPRNTPTCVGKTSKVGKWYIVAKKHPHVRGEDVLRLSCTVFGWETPPRAWGRHQHIVKEREFNHNIHVLRQF